MTFPSYPAYKDSGVEWLGEVPEHWELRRLGNFFDERREKVSDKDFPALSVTKNGVVPQLETAAKTDDGDNRKLVRAGDFVINSRSDRKGSSGLADLDGSVSLINTVLEPANSVRGRYVHHLLRSTLFQEEYFRFGKGIVADLWSTNYSEMKEIRLAVPTLIEQAAIATFLDRETAKIDALVAEQEKLIELLKEKRQAVISHAVTKGLDPSVPMKDSGVGWLGEVPAHWRTSPLRYCVTFVSGGTPNKSRTDYWDGDVPWASAKDLKTDELTDTIDHLTDVAISERAASLVHASSTLVVVRGMILARHLPVSVAAVTMAINQDLKAIVANVQMSSAFLPWLLKGTQEETLSRLDEAGHGTKALRMEAWTSMLVTVPPLAEQVAIANWLKGVTDNLQELQRQAGAAVRLLEERRAALISSTVTGQIDVRVAFQEKNFQHKP